MKTLKLTLTGILLMFLSFGLFAQSSDPPDPPGDHGSDQDQPGGQAPLSGGMILLLGLSAAYGIKKLYVLKKTDGIINKTDE
ncbi:MAG: hypothetical protein GXO86_06030 [Chlorobi bacterium]|nr:hypothetical protein [Chlorobiota bacterium]